MVSLRFLIVCFIYGFNFLNFLEFYLTGFFKKKVVFNSIIFYEHRMFSITCVSNRIFQRRSDVNRLKKKVSSFLVKTGKKDKMHDEKVAISKKKTEKKQI